MNREGVLKILGELQEGISRKNPLFYYFEYLKFLVINGDIKVSHIKDVRTKEGEESLKRLEKDIKEVFGK